MALARDMPIVCRYEPLLFLALAAPPAGESRVIAAASTCATRCFVLPGAGSGATKSYRVVDAGMLEEAGEHVCVQVRRLAFHPSGRYLYANCNNGPGVADALQLWSIEPDGSLVLVERWSRSIRRGWQPVLLMGASRSPCQGSTRQ